jgi:hypothetical protein
LRIDEIVTIFSRTEAVDKAELKSGLARLARHPVADGSTVSFVSEDTEGVWRAAGI